MTSPDGLRPPSRPPDEPDESLPSGRSATDATDEVHPVGLREWRLAILDGALTAAAGIGLVATVSSIVLSAFHGLWVLIVVDVIAYSALVVATVRRSLGYELRAGLLIALLAGVGFAVLGVVGPFGVGLSWLLAVPCVAAILFDRPAWYATNAAVGVGLGLVALAARAGWIWTRTYPLPDAAWWAMAASSLACLSALIGLSASTAVRGLQSSLDTARERGIHLSDERERLARVNRELRAEIERRVEVEQQLALVRKLDAVGLMAGGIAHDFNNLMTVIRLEALMGADASTGTVKKHLESIVDATTAASALSSRLLSVSRQRGGPRARVPVDERLAGLAPLVARLVGERVKLALSLGAPGARSVAEPTQIDQLLTNLAANARDAMPDGGSLDVATRPEERGGAAGVVIEVTDHGVGMDPETRSRVFEPFFTTRPEGTGLGLTTVHA
ncbi:MAG: ATP-binding protein, partial [Myxococcota bacterium]